MRHNKLTIASLAVAAQIVAIPAEAAPEADFASRFVLEGVVQPRPASAIAQSDWSVGGETVDRRFSDSDGWLPWLGPLGAKRLRLQTGWARTDKADGTVDFTWLDTIVDRARAAGVQPWLSLSYGNPAYSGGGTIQRDSALPSGPGRVAWLRYVSQIIGHYRRRVTEWEIWNEPDLSGNYSADDYGTFAFETAQAIKSADPKAKVIFGAFAHQVEAPAEAPPGFAELSLRRFVALGGRGLADIVTYHAYAENPDESYPGIERFRAMVHAIDPGLEVRQGENGAPSLNQPLFALKNKWWTEESQAKWLLRRMIADAGHGIPTSMFTIADLDYPAKVENAALFAKTASQRTAPWAKNMKGLLEVMPRMAGQTEASVRPKAAYRAMQNVTAIFDARLRPTAQQCTFRGGTGAITAYAFRRADGVTVLALWRSSDKPGDRPMHDSVNVACPDVRISGPLKYVDLLTGAVYRMPGSEQDGGLKVAGLPVYDSPVLLVDAAAVPQ